MNVRPSFLVMILYLVWIWNLYNVLFFNVLSIRFLRPLDRLDQSY